MQIDRGYQIKPENIKILKFQGVISMAAQKECRFFLKLRITLFFLVTILMVLPVTLASAENTKTDKNWEFLITPYAMLANINGDASVGRTNGGDVDVSTSDILDNLELAAMIRLEGIYKQKWGLAFDYGFMDLEKESSGPLNGVITAGTRQTIIEIFGFRRVPADFGKFDIYAGARRWRNKVHLVLDPSFWPGAVSTTVNESWWDGFVGARAFFDVAPKWTFLLRGDIGGLGLSSDFTAFGLAGIMYHITDTISLDIEYNALWVDYETGTANTKGHFAYDTVTHGPVIGMVFKF